MAFRSSPTVINGIEPRKPSRALRTSPTVIMCDNGVHSAAAQILACPALRHRRQHPVTLIGPSRDLA